MRKFILNSLPFLGAAMVVGATYMFERHCDKEVARQPLVDNMYAPVFTKAYMDVYDTDKDRKLDEFELTQLIHDLHPWGGWSTGHKLVRNLPSPIVTNKLEEVTSALGKAFERPDFRPVQH